MSSKVVEADAGIHSLAMAVAVRFFSRFRYALIYMSAFFGVSACHQLAPVRYEISFIVPTCIRRRLSPLATFD